MLRDLYEMLEPLLAAALELVQSNADGARGTSQSANQADHGAGPNGSKTETPKSKETLCFRSDPKFCSNKRTNPPITRFGHHLLLFPPRPSRCADNLSSAFHKFPLAFVSTIKAKRHLK